MVAYGIKGAGKANTIRQVVKSFMIDNLKLEKEWVDKLPIKSTITLQSNGSGPPPVRISFFYPNERDKVLPAGTNLKGSDMSIRTDLPKPLRIQKAKLAKEGYEMKKRGSANFTSLREKGIDILLIYRNRTDSKW